LKLTAIASLSLLVAVGCASNKAEKMPPLSACAKDLVDHDYVTKSSAQAAETYCTSNSPEQIAMAKALVDGKYETQLGEAIADSKDMTQTQVDCAKAEFDAKPADSRKFMVSDTCKGIGTDTAAAEASAEAAPTEAPAAQDVLAVASESADLSTFVKLLNDAGMTDTVKGAGPITLLAPTDEAFAKVPKLAMEKLSKDPEKLKKVLSAHVVMGSVSAAAALESKKPTMVKPVEGKAHPMKAKGGVVQIGKAKVVRPDVPASNGNVEVIDAVLMP